MLGFKLGAVQHALTFWMMSDGPAYAGSSSARPLLPWKKIQEQEQLSNCLKESWQTEPGIKAVCQQARGGVPDALSVGSSELCGWTGLHKGARPNGADRGKKLAGCPEPSRARGAGAAAAEHDRARRRRALVNKLG